MNTTESLAGSHVRTYTALFSWLKLSERPGVSSPDVSSGPDFDVHDQPVDHTPHLLLVIDPHQVRLIRTRIINGVLEQLLPIQDSECFRLTSCPFDFSRDTHKPAQGGFYEPLTKALRGIARILVFGVGAEARVELDQFFGWAKAHHAQLYKRIIGSVVVDENHLSDGELLATARTSYRKLKGN